ERDTHGSLQVAVQTSKKYLTCRKTRRAVETIY
ncbi:hypothetical protein PF006_g16911, partial [Phytophthora fragariae]